MTDVLQPSAGGSSSGTVAAAETGGLESAAGTTAAESRFPCLDGYRALAALAVVVTHIGFQTGRSLHGTGHSILYRGDIGVPVFFVLSGFLLYRPMVYARLSGRPLPTLRDYLVRRGLRVLPAYWVSVVLVMFVLTSNAAARHQTGQWFSHLFLAQVYGNNDHVVGLEQDWSLCVEVSFYLLLPLWPRLLHVVSRRRPSLRVELLSAAGLFAVTFLWLGLLSGWGVLPVQASAWLPAHLDWFACGMALAAVSVIPACRPDLAPKWAWLTEIADSPWTCWLGALAVFALACTPLGGRDDLRSMHMWQSTTRELLFAVFAVLLLLPGFLGDQSRGLPRLFLRSRPMRALGTMSYGIFLLHMGEMFFVYQVTNYAVFGGHFWTVLGLVLAMAIATAYLSLRIVEMPALRLKRRFGSSQPSISAGSS